MYTNDWLAIGDIDMYGMCMCDVCGVCVCVRLWFINGDGSRPKSSDSLSGASADADEIIQPHDDAGRFDTSFFFSHCSDWFLADGQVQVIFYFKTAVLGENIHD